MAKDEEVRFVLRKRGYKILELCYDSYSDRKRDQLYEEIQLSLGLSFEECPRGVCAAAPVKTQQDVIVTVEDRHPPGHQRCSVGRNT